ncbi:MAG: hypothetical protein ACRD0L_06125 [Acidimicrobiales bacterium]
MRNEGRRGEIVLRRLRTRLLTVPMLGMALVTVLVLGTAAPAFAVSSTGITYQDTTLCVKTTAQVSTPPSDGYFLGTTRSLYTTPQQGYPFCSFRFTRPAHYIKVHVESFIYNYSQRRWLAYDGTYWYDNPTADWSYTVTFTGNTCGAGYYFTAANGYVLNGTWPAGNISSPQQYLS